MATRDAKLHLLPSETHSSAGPFHAVQPMVRAASMVQSVEHDCFYLDAELLHGRAARGATSIARAV
jgi:hypothetical protein